MTTQIKAGVIAANAVNSSELASGALSGQNFTGDITFDTTTLVIDSTNNRVGIGTTSPNALLEAKSSAPEIRLTDSVDNSYTRLRYEGSAFLIEVDDNASGAADSNFRIQVDGTEAMRIDTSGNVGIGTINPSTGLEVATTNYTFAGTNFDIYALFGDTSGGIRLGADSSNEDSVIGTTGTNNLQFVTYNGSAWGSRMTLTNTGNVGIGTTSPDHDLHIQSTDPTLILAHSGSINNANSGRILFAESPSYTTNNSHFEIKYDGLENHLYFGSPIDGSTDLFVVGRDGNVGIAAVPSGEAAAAHVVRLGDQVCITEYDDGSNPEQFNLFHNSDSSETYIETGTASVIQQRAGEIIFKNAASGSAGAAISFSERMRITTSGTMGFGMQPLGTNNGSAFFDGNVSSKDGFMTTASDLQLIQPSAGNSIFVRDNGNESMRIDSNGIVLVGTTTREIGFLGNANAMAVAGGSNSIFPMVVFADQDTSVEGQSTILELSYDSDVSYSSANYALFSDQTATQGSISGTGAGTVAYNTSSDERIKENIVDTGSQLERIKQIQVRDFNYIGNNTTTTGMIAQELNTIIPNVVVEGSDDATKHPWGIDYGKLTPYLIKAIQEQQTIIDDLKSRLDEAGL